MGMSVTQLPWTLGRSETGRRDRHADSRGRGQQAAQESPEPEEPKGTP